MAGVLVAEASMDLTVAAISQCADFMSDRSNDVNDFDPSFTELMHDSKVAATSGIGDGKTTQANGGRWCYVSNNKVQVTMHDGLVKSFQGTSKKA